MVETVIEVLKKGIEAHKAGQFQKADQFYTAILKEHPNHPDANHNIGVLAVSIGQVEKSIPFLRKAIEFNPNVDQFWLSYVDALIKLNQFKKATRIIEEAKRNGVSEETIERIKIILRSISTASEDESKNPPRDDLQEIIVLYRQGKFEPVLTKVTESLKQFPESIHLYNIRGGAYTALGQFDLAIASFNQAIVFGPDYADTYNNMGVAYHGMGNIKIAIENFQKALSLRSDYVDAHYNLANSFQAFGNIDAAINNYKKALKLRPEYTKAYYNMASAYQTRKNPQAAIKNYKKALAINPQYVEAYNNIGVALHETGNLAGAIKNYRYALHIKPDYAEVYNNLGVTLDETGDFKGAVNSFRRALEISPNYTEAFNNLGNVHKYRGEIEEAINCYKLALRTKPRFTISHLQLSKIKNYSRGDEQIKQMEKLYQDKTLNNDQRCHLNFALSKAFEDIGELHLSFQHLTQGNILRKKTLSYQITQDIERFKSLKFSIEKIYRNAADLEFCFEGITPIFILGMPRSGTSLVEQIISSHSNITGAGELNYVNQFGASIAEGKIACSKQNLRRFRKKYLDKLRKISKKNRYVTDKMPQNFRYIGLICCALPEAKIIHVKRDPAATCWSNYKQYFPDESLGYCYDLKDLVEYFKLYRKIMRFWHEKHGSHVYDLNYDTLTFEQEKETRKLIDYIEVGWEEACLFPHQNDRSVRTASSQQVKKKIYRGSSQNWRKYEKMLGGLFDKFNK